MNKCKWRAQLTAKMAQAKMERFITEVKSLLPRTYQNLQSIAGCMQCDIFGKKTIDFVKKARIKLAKTQ